MRPARRLSADFAPDTDPGRDALRMIPLLTPAEDLARALSRFLAAPPETDPWRRYPAVLQIEHVAEILGCTQDAVRERCRRGGLPLRKRAGRYMIDQVAFRRWLAEDEAVA